MCSRFRDRLLPRAGPSGVAMNRTLVAVVASSMMALTACQRESRHFEPVVGASITPPQIRMSDLQPAQASPSPPTPPHDTNAFALAEGKRLFGWYNCNGCHANGGGDKGPALMDDVWIYGSEPANIYATIVEGRPNGMPSFAGRIPEDQAWQIAAYVRSMSGQLKTDVAPNRGDSLSSGPPESRRDKLTPKTQEPAS